MVAGAAGCHTAVGRPSRSAARGQLGERSARGRRAAELPVEAEWADKIAEHVGRDSFRQSASLVEQEHLGDRHVEQDLVGGLDEAVVWDR